MENIKDKIIENQRIIIKLLQEKQNLSGTNISLSILPENIDNELNKLYLEQEKLEQELNNIKSLIFYIFKKEKLSKLYEECIEKVSEEVGTWVSDYYKGDHGEILADNGFYTNEDEIEQRAKEIFTENVIDDPFSYIDEEEFKKFLLKFNF